MKCVCCNKNLSDFEATRRHALTNDFLDMCKSCLSEVQRLSPLATKDRIDLDHEGEDYGEQVDDDAEDQYTWRRVGRQNIVEDEQLGL
tara:strand:+ start:2079 stop:2342 length:264 start_codon:yes stop_codon:yes gene_type:complete